ncbi:hypothetical protein NDU88_005178 [Pleurodeles waltl]|uniref:Uncharacterized protein n=1 Tax=Pleurodeles waltl TaxID=8319 RepID=A0AAV7TBV2_PLEWA|nr:hypothetical protein NDU88_005178 [Pleurodeles waltl]
MLIGPCQREGAVERARLGSHDNTAWILIRLLRSTINFAMRKTEYWYCAVRKAAKAIGTLLWISNVNMAPKHLQNIGDKGEGAQLTHVGRDGNDTGPASRRPASGPIKLSSKAGGGPGKDGKNGKNGKEIIRGAPSEPRGKGKSQPVITNFLTSGAQADGIESSASPPEDTALCLQENIKIMTQREEALQAKEGPSGNISPPAQPQDGEWWQSDDLRSFKEQTGADGVCARASISDIMQPQLDKSKQATQAAQGTHDLASRTPLHGWGRIKTGRR